MENVTEHVVVTTGSLIDEDPIVSTVTMTCIALSDQLVFVDCGVIPAVARRFRSAMKERFNRNTSHLLLTHMHWDHIFGLEVFEDVTVISSKVGVQYLKRNLKGMFSKEKREKTIKRRFSDKKEIADCYKKAKLFLPHTGVKEEMIIGSEDIIIFRVIGGHTADSACIYFPGERVLCTGDNLITCFAQLPGSPATTLKIFQYWETLNIDKVIPGHGQVVGKEYITKVRLYFEALLSVLKELKSQNIPLKDVLHQDLPHYFGKDLPSWIEGGIRHTGWLERNILSWYKSLNY